MADQTTQHDPATGPELKRTPTELAAVLEGYIQRASDADHPEGWLTAFSPEVLETFAEAAALLAFFGKATRRSTAKGEIVLSLKQTQASWGVYVTALTEGGREQQMQLDATGEGQAFEEAAKMLDGGALATLIVVRSMIAYDVRRPCPDCGGEGVLTHDIIVGGTDHDTEERPCATCKGSGFRK